MDAVLREFTSPLLVQPEGVSTITDLFVARWKSAPEHIQFDVPAGENPDGSTQWHERTTHEFYTAATSLARHLIAAGIEPGSSVAIMGPTSYAWALADVACLWVGAVVVPIYDTSAAAQVKAIVADAEVTHAFAGNATHAALLSDALGSNDAVWTMSETAGNYRSLSTIMAEEPTIKVSDDDLEARRTSRGFDDIASIVYTSGTMSDPKGVLITHGNFITQVQNIGRSHEAVLNERMRTILFLPLSHVLARAFQLASLHTGVRVAHLSDTSKVIPTFAEIRPTFVIVVPRVLEKIVIAVANKAKEKKLGAVWARAVGIAARVGEASEGTHEFAEPKLPLRLRIQHALYDRLFYRKIRELLGGNITYIISGGAKLHPDLARTFRGFHVPIIEGYGLTETTAPLAANLPGDLKVGTVGPPAPGMSILISDDGEVLAKGPGVSPGYRNPEHTKAAYVDGYLRTGDLGSLDDKGRLTLRGRSKEVIVTSGGKTVEPAGWEGEVERHPNIAYAVAVGDDRPYLTALLIQQMEPGEGEGDSVEMIENPKLIADLLEYIEDANENVSRTERIRKFALVKVNLDDPSIMTPSMKLKRSVFLEKARETIDQMYEKAPSLHIHDVVGRSKKEPRE